MQTTLFEVIFYDGRKFKVFCRGRDEFKRFFAYCRLHHDEIESWRELSNGIHTITEFEKIITNEL